MTEEEIKKQKEKDEEKERKAKEKYNTVKKILEENHINGIESRFLYGAKRLKRSFL